ncbi:carboxymuconolactone decarboxylase family protein [Pseudoduganella umbonata]|uniref:Peroxidase-related enzyme n=1 Tax=Pseudoduganella umbonata TaxID=864828 RepID=A0A4P8HLQ2_9BURK|nr:peroxidase-related enzyme [Pseudoduganella umbonata]MBB3224983.1 putative peroxidase-related enzyme [Pseudoduganella umbonata]QCP09252.1 peroxidase-related enzyme [Pseudoduganella umbonata]
MSHNATTARVALLTRDTATGASQQLLAQVHGAFGATPNMFRAVANSPAALASMWAGFGALGNGTLGARLGEQIAVAIADINDCEYCLAAHTALGRKAGASGDEMAAAQAGQSDDPRTAAALKFATRVVRNRAKVDAAEVDALREAGFDDGQIVEIVAHVALNLFTNYVNVALAVPVDFPQVKLRAK